MTGTSCIYEGIVEHFRRTPVAHQFRYRLFLMFVDLDELPRIFERFWLWSAGRPNFAWFRRADHLGPPEQPLKESVLDLVHSQLGWRPSGPVRLLTHFRYAGFQMNPVSLFYCYSAQSDSPVALVAEVNNTPWNERHCYVLDLHEQDEQDERKLTATQPKQFHVSPFLGMDFDYHWQLNAPGSELTVQIENWDGTNHPFAARLTMHRVPLNSWNLARVLVTYPLITMRVFLGIYWQALVLWVKRIPYVPHPQRTSGKSVVRDSSLVASSPEATAPQEVSA